MFFSTTGGGKTETLFSLMLNSLCHARGFTMMDGKAQNDTARTIWYLALRFGREDDVEFINYMTGGRSRSELLHAGDKSLPESTPSIPLSTPRRHWSPKRFSRCCPRTSRGNGSPAPSR